MGAKVSNPPSEQTALRLVVEGTVSETGTDFFRALVRNLAAVMGTSGAWVTEFLSDKRSLRTRAFWLNGNFIDNYEHPIDDTPCQQVVEGKRLLHIPDRIVELYPTDNDLRKLQAVSYLGVPLLDSDGGVMGHLAVLDSKPLPQEPRLLSLFEIFAARAAAECRRLKIEQEVRAREEQLRALLDSAMDAIIVFDAQCHISSVNPAAQRLFGCTSEDLLGEALPDFFQPDSAARLERFLRELDARPEGQRHLWIPQSLIALRWNRSTFPAEATLSRFENRRQVFYTLILRNVNERLEADQKIQSLTSETEYLREEIKALHNFDEILGQSRALRRVLQEVQQVASTDAVVLLQGETGTGKELFARAIHAASPRRHKPMVTVNCAAIPASLIESEFFGHEKGAFTGATAKREGRFSLAHQGTLFLDEVGELPHDLQGKLLRVLQEGTFEPVGSSRTLKVDTRIIAATNRDLLQEVQQGRFRQDLYYRLNVFPIRLPPLRERLEDVRVLAAAFVRRFAARMGRPFAPLDEENLRRLQAYPWPGNVRELENVIERAVITAQAGKLNLDRSLPGATSGVASPSTVESPPVIKTVHQLEELERDNIVRALEHCSWRISGEKGAARLLGMNPSTLNSRLKALRIKRPAAN
jgi:PAS domain S-box-containing protein